MIKLIKNLKLGQDVEMVKGCSTDMCPNGNDYMQCAGTISDVCNTFDYGSCGNTDICGEDRTDCLYYDYCPSIDTTVCSGLQYDQAY